MVYTEYFQNLAKMCVLNGSPANVNCLHRTRIYLIAFSVINTCLVSSFLMTYKQLDIMYAHLDN